MATLQEIAKRAGVSPALVSVVLNGKAEKVGISKKRAEEVLRIAKEMHYRPNSAARAIQTRRSKLVGVLLRDEPEPFSGANTPYEVILGINQRLQQDDYVLCLISSPGEEAASALQDTRIFRERLLDGLIVFGSRLSPRLDPWVEPLQNSFPRSLWLDCGVWLPHNCLRWDDVQAGRMVARAVLEHGYQRLLFVTGKGLAGSAELGAEELEEGVRSEAAAAGHALEVTPCTHGDGTIDFTVLRALVDEKLGSPGDRGVCLIASDCLIAQALSRAAGSRGRIAGCDFGLVSCSDSPGVDKYWPGLSRVRNDPSRLGAVAAEMMLQILAPDEADSGSPAATAVPSRKLCGDFLAGETLSEGG